MAKGPDIHSTPPDVRHNEDATGDNPDEAEPETDVQHAEHVVQDQLTAQFVTRQRFTCFIEAEERSGPRLSDAKARVELTDDMIRETDATERPKRRLTGFLNKIALMKLHFSI
ncbi:TPA: hypothetical protein ACH3X2_000295 [Trebouxia sp. C0005]